ncbi:MAG: serine/threonine-protein kinase [Polyangiales bacterium]
MLDSKYRIDAVLGEGGVGVVYRAEHTTLHRPVAIKMLNEQGGAREEVRRRFHREARALSSLSHPHIVAVSDFGMDGDVPFLVMELLEGRTLASHLDAHGPLQPRAALHIAQQILRGLAYAHRQRVMHRDLKPANIILQALPDNPLHVKIVDFGLAKLVAGDGEIGRGEPTLTRNGAILGTPAYMAPEQASGGNVDVRVDVYAAAIVLFEMLTGRCPFHSHNCIDVLHGHLFKPVPAMTSVRPDLVVDPDFVTWIECALAKEADARFADAAAMLAALEALPTSPVRLHRPRSGEEPTPALPMTSMQSEVSSAQRPSDLRAFSSTHLRQLSQSSVISLQLDRERRRGWWWRLGALGGALVLVLFGVTAVWTRVVAPTAHPPSPAPTVAKSSSSPVGVPAPRSAAVAAKIEPEQAMAQPVTRGAAPAAKDDNQVATGAAAAVSAASLTVVPARDPLQSKMPRVLRRAWKKARSRSGLSRRSQRVLRGYQREHGDDPRPSLILAHALTRQNWYDDALARYALAHRIDASCRGAKPMLDDLLTIGESPRWGGRAVQMVRDIYGAEALDAVQARLQRAALDRKAHRRFSSLQAELRAAGAP